MTSTEPSRTSALAQGRKRAQRYPPQLWQVPVLATTTVTPRMIRVTVGGPELADFPPITGEAHVVLYFYEPGAVLPQPLTLSSARNHFAVARPAMRSYTLRRHDPLAHELDLDFVLHEATGPAAAWASGTAPGDSLIVVGPSPGYQPDPAVAAHLFIGDETALPAIEVMLADLPETATATVLVEVADAAEEQQLTSPAELRVHWLHRDGRPAGTENALVEGLTALEVPTGDTSVWAAGERAAVHAVRNHLLTEVKLDRRQVRASSYWRLGHQGSPSGG
ncbi:MAG TPA: siderophore-interacting protein [Pseudonocardiaceae bacterium]|jgi:NADPH-dependent ferric siderophore reductase|nr:siderophore-interacting protein [Pseudonocardiaceae bacterium]